MKQAHTIPVLIIKEDEDRQIGVDAAVNGDEAYFPVDAPIYLGDPRAKAAVAL